MRPILLATRGACQRPAGELYHGHSAEQAANLRGSNARVELSRRLPFPFNLRVHAALTPTRRASEEIGTWDLGLGASVGREPQEAAGQVGEHVGQAGSGPSPKPCKCCSTKR